MIFNSKLTMLFILLSFTSCGLKQIVIPNVDMAIERKLRKDMRLDRTQQKLLANDVDIMLNKLTGPTNKYLYPIVKDFNIEEINKLKTELLIDRINKVYFMASQELAIIMAKYMSQLNERQQRHQKKVYSKENKKIEKRSKDYNTDLIIQRFEFFLGNLNQEQIKIIKEHKTQFMKKNKRRLAQRITLGEKIDNIYKNEKNDLKRQKLFLDSYKEYIKKTQEYFKSEDTKSTYIMALNVIKASNKKQKERFQSKIETAADWIQYFSTYEF